MNAARLPPSMARSPSRDRSPRLSGAMPPMPPIWIAIDGKLANPSSAYVAMTVPRGVSAPSTAKVPDSSR